MSIPNLPLRSKLDQYAGRNPVFAKRLQAVRARFGENWDPGSVLARRLRAIGYVEWFLQGFAKAGVLSADVRPWVELAFGEVREALARHVDPAFAQLPFDRALELVKPRRGPNGAAGVAGRWSAAVGAFGDSDATAVERFKQALKDTTPARRTRKRPRPK